MKVLRYRSTHARSIVQGAPRNTLTTDTSVFGNEACRCIAAHPRAAQRAEAHPAPTPRSTTHLMALRHYLCLDLYVRPSGSDLRYTSGPHVTLLHFILLRIALRGGRAALYTVLQNSCLYLAVSHLNAFACL